MKYHLDQKIPFFANLLYGLQWLIVSLPFIIIMGSVVGNIHYNDVAMQTMYMQKIFLVMGITIVVQILWGHRLPLVMGPASVLLVGILATLSADVSVIYTSVMLGGLLMATLAFSGLIAKLRFIFTSRVITVILILIPFTLMPTILKLITVNDHNILFSLVFAFSLIVFLLLANKYLPGVWKSMVVICGLLVGTFAYYGLTGFPTIKVVGYSSTVFSDGFFVKPTFDVGVLIAFLLCFMVQVINELGSIEALGEMLNADKMEKRVKRGIVVSGLSNIVSGSVGTIGSVNYSMSAGVISATGCASRYTLIPAGLGLIACSFFPQVVSILNHIPTIVMGTFLLYLMSTQLSSGLMMLVREKVVVEFEDGIVVGLSLMIAVLISFIPSELANQIPSIIKPVVGNGFVVGVITVLLLDQLIFRKKRKQSELVE